MLKTSVLTMMLVLAATAASAGPIYATHTGCIQAQPGQAEWVSPEYFSFASYWDWEAGCDPTLAIPTQMYTSEWLDNGWYRVTVTSEMLPLCGRGQFDAASITDPWHTWLIVDTGVDCDSVFGPEKPKLRLLVESIEPFFLGPEGEPEVESLPPAELPPGPTPEQFPPAPIPEPSSLVLTAVGAVLLARFRPRASSRID